MKYRLHIISTNEVVDTVELASEVGITGATTYFRLRKDLPQKEFDKIWVCLLYTSDAADE